MGWEWVAGQKLMVLGWENDNKKLAIIVINFSKSFLFKRISAGLVIEFHLYLSHCSLLSD